FHVFAAGLRDLDQDLSRVRIDVPVGLLCRAVPPPSCERKEVEAGVVSCLGVIHFGSAPLDCTLRIAGAFTNADCPRLVPRLQMWPTVASMPPAEIAIP